MEIELPNDFKEFLKLLTSHQVEYLLIGGFAVTYYGYQLSLHRGHVGVPQIRT
jgi:hypothetical protein